MIRSDMQGWIIESVAADGDSTLDTHRRPLEFHSPVSMPQKWLKSGYQQIAAWRGLLVLAVGHRLSSPHPKRFTRPGDL
jgi:hypothetical protein